MNRFRVMIAVAGFVAALGMVVDAGLAADVPAYLPGDANGDGFVDDLDLPVLVSAFGSDSPDAGFDASCDFNGDGSVDVIDLLTLAENWGQPRICPGFFRTSPACLDGVPFAVDMPRTGTIAVCSASDGICMKSSVMPPGAGIAPECTLAGKLILRSTDGHVYGSTDGVNVTRLSSTPPQLNAIWALTSGTLVGWCQGVGLMRSDDGGVTWSQCLLNGTWTPGASPLHQSFLDVGGVQFVGEYTSAHVPLAGRYVWKSIDDGATWTPCLDGAAVEPDVSWQWYHIHSLGYHAATGRVVVGCGDDDDRHQIWCSPDLGVTWSRLEANRNDIPAQPMCWVDNGDPTRILFADDTNRGVGWLDVITGDLGDLVPWTDGRYGTSERFGLYQIGGLYYATGRDFASSHKRPAILVSSDLVHWVVYHAIPDSDGFLTYAGMVGGRLHFMYYGIGMSAWLSISPAVVENRTAMLLEPGATNLLNAQAGFFEDSTGGWSLAGTSSWMGWCPTDNLAGSATSGCLMAQYTGPPSLYQYVCLTSPQVSVSPGSAYGGLVWARCDSGSTQLSIAMLDAYGVTGTSCDYYVDSTWRPLFAAPLLPYSHSVGLRLWFGPTDRCRSVKIDAAQVSQLPITQVQYSPATRGPDRWCNNVAVGTQWQNDIVLSPSVLPYQLAAGTRYYVRSWVRDADNHLQLYYDTKDGEFHLLTTIGGVAQTPLSTSAMEWGPLACLRISVSVGAAGPSMTIANGGVPVTISGTADCTALTNGVVAVCAGNAGGGRLLPHYLVMDLDSWQ